MALFRGHNALLSKYTTPSGFIYDIFLSFRGKDTRKNFTDHLYTALFYAGFHTFLDDRELERGENIKEKLENAIQQSRSSVIVFSKDYTSSRWCLDELVMILERKRTSNHFVLPVFYNVNPSQVRNMAESLAKVPKYQENESSERLNGWLAALGEVADLAGMVLENEVNGHESKFIHNIVTVIQKELGRVPLKDVQEVLQKKLLFINPVLDDAEVKQLNNPTVKAWLNELKEVVYDAEDIMQDIKTEALRLKMESESASSTSKVRELNSSLPSHALVSALIYPRVEEVLNRLHSIMEQRKDVLGMEASAGYMLSQKLPSTSLVEESSVCGRDEEKEMLVELVLSDDESGNKISVIAIVGMGGIGKTTLAQLLYNDVRVEQHFDIQAWACVSENFDVLWILQEIYESLTSDTCNIVNLNLLQSKLEVALTGKMIFLVLDDLWNKKYTEWDVLMRPFQYVAPGSKIIVTTRNQDVARMVCTTEVHHHLMPISEEDSWSLFEKHAFRNVGVGAHSHFEEIGRQIVQKCNGLPLAIKSLGGMLCSKLNVDEWEAILNSELWELPQEESDVLPSLWLSYVHLPPDLRRCFAYCSIFPKNYAFKTSELVYLWKAEDLLQPKKNETAEDIGQEYINDLILRSFFQLHVEEFSYSSSDDLESYTMHDLINDLANFAAGEFCVRWENSDSPNVSSKTRHFSYVPQNRHFYGSYPQDPCSVGGLQMFDALQQAKSLHTFLPLKVYGWTSSRRLFESFPKLQCLRVLKLKSYYIEILPDSINNLKHLRHLDLSETTIRKLPDTVCTLYNLQALLLFKCYFLTELPANLGRLINLSHLDIRGTQLKKMPPYMGNLKDLQMLAKFVLDKETARGNLPEVERLQNLRGTLCISGLVHSSILEAYILRDKKFLKELVLTWGPTRYSQWEDRYVSEEGNDTVEEREVLEKLHPPLNLESLTIEVYGGQVFPGWSGYYFSYARLVNLKLVNCKNCISLPPLGQLPSLIELDITGLDGVVSIGSEFYYGDGNTSTCVNKPFRSLLSLAFSNMRGWKEWSFIGGDDIVTFPKLTTLKIWSCENLSSWPEQVLYTNLPSLFDVYLCHCPELECFPEGGFPSKLISLHIEGCKKVNANSMRRLTSLEKLILDFDCDEERLLPSTLTDLDINYLNCETIDSAKWFDHLNSLLRLRITSCPALRCLPESGLPTSLQTLIIYDCPELRCLPDCGLPSSLSRLFIYDCPLLHERCQRETGEDWPKIAHIPMAHSEILGYSSD